MDMAMDTIVPESLPWEHTDEGPDDSVSHLKTSLIGNSVTLPISKGKLVFGTWQGIYLAEFRHSGAGWGGRGQGRKVIATIL
ncbi:uncharacterized protein I303_104709 [Kwoniella dejecticola CBS 10117]|uniref:Secondary thiamine-phosphate synthase enzyme n=1 Tax=Kwoniella dejecticola CBS 10117 TaxID=1296121 RepID=A0A1A6A4J3_9TREE|nr:secondary thiamine-phosphate synthase enzyme [Kwoniella dejecticola CBS 10117]OBR84985.1 secondary thiamine-phosphate synthase enzyme [Kwoniella dejecticola CBS 10117]